MGKERTLIIIKPDGMEKMIVGECLRRFERAGLEIKDIKMYQISINEAKRFYSHIEKDYPNIYKPLLSFMTQRPVIMAVLEGNNAVKKVRNICGPTDPSKASKGTIRGDYGKGSMAESYKQKKVVKNAIHASSSLKDAKFEIGMFFKKRK
jgi:nucleoside-diphosphate kinase